MSLLNNSQEIEDPSILINETIDNIRLKEKEQMRNNSDKKLIEMDLTNIHRMPILHDTKYMIQRYKVGWRSCPESNGHSCPIS